MPDLRGLLADPEFNALPIGRRTAILNRIDPGLADEYAQSKGGLDFPGKNASFSQGKPESRWQRTWNSVRESLFGHEDRAEAQAEGLATQPTPADMADAALTGATFMGGPALALRGAGAVASRIPGAAGKAMGWAASHPKATLAAVNAAPDLAQGDLEGAAVMAGIGALEGTALGSVANAVRGGAGKGVAGAVREGAKQAVAAAAPKAAPKVAAIADRGKAAASAHKDLMAFAKNVAKEDPKVGEKIWMLLDDAGRPVKRLTPDQAAAAKRGGRQTTWVRNLWR